MHARTLSRVPRIDQEFRSIELPRKVRLQLHERVLKLRLRRMEINAEISVERASRPRNTLASRTLQPLPGEVFA